MRAAPPQRPVFIVHGHFYQPPREDPSRGLVPVEEGAAPYPNWNAKITAECYRPNAELGNFERLSFDLGPTLARWLAADAPDAHARIAASDRGGAIAQPYNHTILPLATRRDKVTQVRWGIADFEHRFGRRPRGMWLPETAVDHETLEVLAEHGIEFTILAPWQSATPEVDTRRPYRVRLTGGRSISVFFFDGALSAEVSFDPEATRVAAEFGGRLRSSVGEDRAHDGPLSPAPGGEGWGEGAPPVVLVATDGELYGHHQRGREHFLHELLFREADRAGLEVLHPAAYLDRYGAAAEIEIAERTSWSCHHGIDRWSTGCGCTEGDPSWKGPVRKALEALTGALDAAYEAAASRLLRDPWAARDDYLRVVLGQEPVDSLIARHSARALDDAEVHRAACLLEAQYYGQWMHTSCGLFWEDPARLEMRNNLAYAARAISLTESAAGVWLEPEFVERLRSARSWRTGETGDEIYSEVVQRAPARAGIRATPRAAEAGQTPA